MAVASTGVERTEPVGIFSKELTRRSMDVDAESTDQLISKVRDVLTNEGRTSLTYEMLEEMIVHLGDERGMARLRLVELFGEIGKQAVDALVRGLRGCGNPVVRRSCGKALAKIGDRRAVSHLVDAMTGDSDVVARASAAGALARVGEGAVAALLEVMRNKEVGMTAKGHAAWALAFMGGEVGEKLFEVAEDESKDVRIAVVGALGALAIGDALPVMAPAGVMEGDDWVENEDGGRKDRLKEKATQVLRRMLDDKAAEVKAEAVTALANLGNTESVGQAEAFLEDENPELRRAAALALMKMNDSSVVESLLRRANDKDEVDSVRAVARLAATTLSRSSRNDEENGW